MYQSIRLDLASLRIYRNILDDIAIKKLIIALDNAMEHGVEALATINAYNDFAFALFKTNRTFKEHLAFLILHDDNPFSKLAEKHDLPKLNNLLLEAVKNDLKILNKLFNLDLHTMFYDDLNRWQDLKVGDIHFSKENDWSNLIYSLANYYKINSRGLVSIYKGFYWERNKGLRGINNLQNYRLHDLVGYDLQIQKLKQNTEKFLKSEPANNVLLYGARGTGKSTAVKSLINEYSQEGLRIVEISRDDLEFIPEVVGILRDYDLKFIIFLDDLSFEDYETGYKELKAVLEGNLEEIPNNILIYATSNRRHLVKEYFSDRARPSSKEIHAEDTMQEKLSLSDRFGLTITFPVMDKKTYLEIVEDLVKKRNIIIEPNLLEKLAIEWERANHGPSGRTALQFVNSLD